MKASVLVPTFRGYTLVGSHEGEADFSCRQCDNLLMHRVAHAQVLDVGIVCPVCHCINLGIRRQLGIPIPTNSVPLKSGDSLISQAIVIPGDGSIVGNRAREDYRREVGYRSQVDSQQEVLSPEFLKRKVKQCIGYIGEDKYLRWSATKRRSEQSATPKKTLNRLVDLIHYADVQAQKLGNCSAGEIVCMDAEPINELVAISGMFERWKQHPAWFDLCKTLSDTDNAYHSLMQLTVASYMADTDNGVSLVFDTVENKRIADVYIRPTFSSRIYAEVKAPAALRNSLTAPLTAEKAAKVITKALDAASTRRGQIDPNDSAIIVIGSFHLDATSITVLEEQATAILQRQASQGRKRHLAFVLIVSSTYRLAFDNRSVQAASSAPASLLSPAAEVRVIPYPGYAGEVQLISGPMPSAISVR